MTDPRQTRRWRRIRATVLERDGRTCRLEYPGCTGTATQVDHIVPVRFGGTDALSNLRAACRRCNRARGDGTEPVSGPVSAW